MLVLTATIENDKIILNGLQDVAQEMPSAVRAGFRRIGDGVYAQAFSLLSGPARPRVRLQDKTDYTYSEGNIDRKTTKKTRLRGQFAQLGARPGTSPVPRVSGNLRALLGWVGPGESKGSSGLDFTAGDLELVLFDSAAYASSIFRGKTLHQSTANETRSRTAWTTSAEWTRWPRSSMKRSKRPLTRRATDDSRDERQP